MNLDDLLSGIQKKDIVLPEFQREYIWTLEQSKQLMVSVFNNYPVGAFIILLVLSFFGIQIILLKLKTLQ